MKRDEITEQINKWLVEETEQQEWKIAINYDDPHYYYCYRIVNDTDTILCTICIEKNIDRVIIMNEITFSRQDGTNYKLSREKGKYWIDLKLQLLNLGIDVKAIPDVERLETIQLRKVIYFDGWSRDRFMNDVLNIIDSSEIPELIFRNYSNYMNEKIQKD
jgi:hypothetical protein